MSKSKRSGDGWKVFGIVIFILIVLLGIGGLVVYGVSSHEDEEEDEVFESVDEDIEDPSYHVHHWQMMNDSVSHWLYCPLCNQVDSDSFESHNFSDVMVVYPYDYNDGYSQYTCADCGYSFTDTIPWDDKYLPEEEDEDEDEPEYDDPETCEHSYVYMSDDDCHWLQCELCGEILEGSNESHDLELLSDSSGHYYYCSVCDYESKVSSHIFKTGYDSETHYSICSLCGYKTNIESHSKTSVTADGKNGHIYKCSCGYTFDEEEHNYGDIYSVLTSRGVDYHYYACKDCSFTSYPPLHASATRDGFYYIMDCNYGPIGNNRYNVTAHCCHCGYGYYLGTISIDDFESFYSHDSFGSSIGTIAYWFACYGGSLASDLTQFA